MLRIVAGEIGGRKLTTPSGLGTRPTAEKVREALFAILGESVVGVRAADFFAGSGALGIEALSRGAAWCLFVEHNRKVLTILESNVARCEMNDRVAVLGEDATKPSRRCLGLAPFDLILADPPYERGLVSRFTAACERFELLTPGGMLVIEHSPSEKPPESRALKLVDNRTYGQTQLSFMESQL